MEKGVLTAFRPNLNKSITDFATKVGTSNSYFQKNAKLHWKTKLNCIHTFKQSLMCNMGQQSIRKTDFQQPPLIKNPIFLPFLGPIYPEHAMYTKQQSSMKPLGSNFATRN